MPSPSPHYPYYLEVSSNEATSRASKFPSQRYKRMYYDWKKESKLQKFKEGGKSIILLSNNGTYGHKNKVLNFIQQFDAAFGGENFTKQSNLCHVAMYLQNLACQWWASMQNQGTELKTWKDCRDTILRPFLMDQAKDDVLRTWQALKLEKGKSIQKLRGKDDYRAAILRQFLMDQAKDDVLRTWQGLKLEKGELIYKYKEKFWYLHLKSIIFKIIIFSY